MKIALRRFAAYFLDLVIIYIVSSIISSVIVVTTNHKEFLNVYEDFTEFNQQYLNFFEYFEESFSDNKLSKNEYNKLTKKYSDIAIGLDSAYGDNKLTKKEYSNIYDKTLEEYNDLYIKKSYKLSKVNTVSTVVLIIATILYFVIIQYFKKGQTLGKKLFRYRIVTIDNEPVTINNLLLRYLIITDVMWSSIKLYCLYTMDAYGYSNASFYLNNIMYLVLFISFLFIVYRMDKRAVQDLFAGTKVIEEK